jgi:hypothetical protein
MVCSTLARLDDSVRGGTLDTLADTAGRPIADADADAVGAR